MILGRPLPFSGFGGEDQDHENVDAAPHPALGGGSWHSPGGCGEMNLKEVWGAGSRGDSTSKATETQKSLRALHSSRNLVTRLPRVFWRL